MPDQLKPCPVCGGKVEHRQAFACWWALICCTEYCKGVWEVDPEDYAGNWNALATQIDAILTQRRGPERVLVWKETEPGKQWVAYANRRPYEILIDHLGVKWRRFEPGVLWCPAPSVEAAKVAAQAHYEGGAK